MNAQPEAVAGPPALAPPMMPPAGLVPPGVFPALDVLRVNTLVRWAFYLFVFSIPLEWPDRPFPLEIHTITGSLFLLVALLQPHLCFRRPPAAFFWLAAYLWVFIVIGVFTAHPAETVKIFFNYLLVAIVFWAAYNLMHVDLLARRAFLLFVAAAAIIAVLQRWGVATIVLEGRNIVLGQDPNMLAGNMALAITMVLGLTYGRERVPGWMHVVAGAAGLALCRAILYAGSRGAALALAAGLVAFACRGGDVRKRTRTIVIVAIAGILVVLAAYRNGSLLKRYEETLSEGDLSGREMIYPEAFAMFRERPLFGWGPIDHFYELGRRTAGYQIGKRNSDGLSVHPTKETHDLVLEMLTSLGLAGALPFFIGVGMCVWAAWKVRSGERGTLPLALVACALTVGLDIDWSASKQLWLVLAYAAASASVYRPRIVQAGPVARYPSPWIAQSGS